MTTITPTTPGPGGISQPTTPASTPGYGDNHEVRLLANVIAGNESPVQRNAINRLNVTLSSDEPPRIDVPRGYYLDILV